MTYSSFLSTAARGALLEHKSDHVISQIKNLQWLSITHRKTAFLFKSLHDLAHQPPRPPRSPLFPSSLHSSLESLLCYSSNILTLSLF